MEEIKEEIKKEDVKKGKSLPLKIVIGLLIVICSLAVIIGAWITWSAVNRTSPLKFIPENYTVIVHTDKVYSAVEPLAGLKAVEILLSEPNLSSARESYMKMRTFINDASPLVTKLIDKRIDVAVWTEEQQGFVAVADLGWLSCVTRLSPVAAGFLNVKNLTWGNGHFEYKAGETIVYARPYKNLLLVTTSKELFDTAVDNFKKRTITESEEKEIEDKKIKTLKILCPSTKIAKMKQFEKYYNEKAEKILGKEKLSSITFDITNDKINIQLRVPVDKEECNEGISEILKLNSTQPRLTGFLTSDTQYYTLINLASLKEMKEQFFPFLEQTNDIEEKWKKADSLCRKLFSLSLEELLFSWSDKEIAAFGIEGSSDPVFAIQIKDEKKREEVFQKLDDSILINTNTNLIVNGMRLPCLELPGFLSSLISVFNVELPRPFYLVNNGYIYFSMSPQNLSSIWTHINKHYIIQRSQNWKNVSSTTPPQTSLELYYNLKRSLPFFLDNSSVFSKILKLYGIGIFDFEITEDAVEAKLFANTAVEEESKMLSGFPKPTGKISDYNLIADNDDDPEYLYWIEEETKLKCLNLFSLEQQEADIFGGRISIASAQNKAGKNNKLWVSTDKGDIYLLDKDLQVAKEFHLDSGFSAAGAAYKNYYVVPSKDGNLIFADHKGNVEEIYIGPDLNIKGRPSVYEDYLAVYNRGFEGEIYLFKGKECINRDKPMIIDGIGFGSPSITKINSNLIIGFLTQKGDFYLFENQNPVQGFPVSTDKIFATNVVAEKDAFYSISDDAVVYKFTLDGNYSCVNLPDVNSAKEAFISSKSFNGTDGIYASGDSNVLYGFNSNLELLMSFPVTGRGVPVFADVNKDKNTNCIVLSISREINSWRIQ